MITICGDDFPSQLPTFIFSVLLQKCCCIWLWNVWGVYYIRQQQHLKNTCPCCRRNRGPHKQDHCLCDADCDGRSSNTHYWCTLVESNLCKSFVEAKVWFVLWRSVVIYENLKIAIYYNVTVVMQFLHIQRVQLLLTITHDL